MKLAFIFAKHRSDLEQYLPLGFGYLASYVSARLPETRLFFARNVNELKIFGPDLVGLSCTTTGYPLAVQLAKRIKSELGCAVCIGGVHISTAPKSLDRTFDFGVMGEGERTLYEICLSWFMRGKFETDGMASIPGLVFQKDAEFIQTQQRTPVEPLDTIPFPDRKFLGYQGEPAHMMTSRGCPYNCRFCSSSTHWKNFRAFSADYVLAEVESLVSEFGTKEIHFYDDLFAYDKTRLEKIAEGIKRKNLFIRFSCAVRAELVDDELCKILREIGVERITFGAESASDKILKNLKGPSASVAANIATVETLAKHGFKVGLSFIVGEPEETEEDALKTYSFILEQVKQGRIDMADVNILTPFPSTHYWHMALTNGMVEEKSQFDWQILARPWKKLLLNQKLWNRPFKLLASEARVRKMLALYEYPRIAIGLKSAEKIPNWLHRYISIADLRDKELKQISEDLKNAVEREELFLAICSQPDSWEKLLALLWFAHMEDAELVQYENFLIARGEMAKILASELESLKKLNSIDSWIQYLGIEQKQISESELKAALDFDPQKCDEITSFETIVEYFEAQNRLRHKIANFARTLWEIVKGKNKTGLKFSEKLMLRLLGRLFH